jgi:hypothetical protein
MIHYRKYENYQHYIKHQCGKDAVHTGMIEYGEMLQAALVERLNPWRKHGEGMLCLGARTGAEVEAFMKMGYFAVGVDINPLPKNPWVLLGDFNDLLWFDETIDNIYTNSLDHAENLTELRNQIYRKLKPGGKLFVDIVAGIEEGYTPGAFESCWWDKVDDVVELLHGSGFKAMSRSPITEPWTGEFVVFRKELK